MLDHVTLCPVSMFEVGILTAPQNLPKKFLVIDFMPAVEFVRTRFFTLNSFLFFSKKI